MELIPQEMKGQSAAEAEANEEGLAKLAQYEATLARLRQPCRAPLFALLKLQHMQQSADQLSFDYYNTQGNPYRFACWSAPDPN